MADIGFHGGHDAGAIIGVHPFLKPIDIYRKHVEGWRQEETERMQEGSIFEAAILELYRQRTGAQMRPGGLRTHPNVPWAVASLDAEATREDMPRVVDAKHPSIHTMRAWKETEGGIPLYVAAQMQWYLGITRLHFADVAVYFGGGAFQVETVEADGDVFSGMMEAVARFRRDHIEAKVPPRPDASDSYSDWLKGRFPKSNGKLIPSTIESASIVSQLLDVKRDLAELEGKEKGLRNQLLALIGDADGIEGLCSYRATKGRATVDWKAVCEAAKVPKDIIETNTKVAGYRVLRLQGGSHE